MRIIYLGILVGLFTSIMHSQDVKGMWLANNTSFNNSINTLFSDHSRLIIDFDATSLGAFNGKKMQKISLNRKKTKLKIHGLKGKFKIEKIKANTLRIKSTKNGNFVFEKLDFSDKISMEENHIRDFLIKQQCNVISGLEGKFTKEIYFKDKKSKHARKRYQFINFSERSNGYWYIKKINGSAYFFFNKGNTKAENIFNISEIKINGLILKPLLENNTMKNLEWLKTCL